MDYRRRSAVDDVRSRRTRAVDEDRRRIRWAVNEDRHRRRWAIDDDRRRRRREINDYPPLELLLQWRDPPPEYPSLFYSASRKGIRNQPIVVDDYPPLELPLRWRPPPLEYLPLELPLRWRDPPPQITSASDSVHFQRRPTRVRPVALEGPATESGPLPVAWTSACNTCTPYLHESDASAQLTGPIPSPLNPSATHPPLPPAQTKPHPTTAAPSPPAAADQTPANHLPATPTADQLPVPPAADQAPAPPAPVSGDSAPWQRFSGDLAPGSDSDRGGESHRLNSRDFAPPTLLSLSDPTASTPVSHKLGSTFISAHDQPRFTPVCDQILLPELPTASFRSSKRPSIPAFTGDLNLQSSTRACSIYTHSLHSTRYPSPTSPIRSASTKPCEQLASDDANMEAGFAPQTPA
ncbi:extensin-like [Dendrobium catenatum]|uniref:extensin-like n=1 Tax=Dendrobium catenatum TaxID=906689 RepID=UPI0010A09585|nr:extensin-like [Dendrobium catenatum]